MAGALVGGAFLSASLEVLFDRMASREVLNFIQGQKLNSELLKKLKITLLKVHAVLNDAEIKQITNPVVREWLDEIKDAVYNAEDLLDEIATEALRYKMEAESQTSAVQVWNTFSTSFNPFGERIEPKVWQVIDKLEFLAQEKDLLGLKEGVGERLTQRWPTTSLVDESGVYGRYADKEKIIGLLLSENESDNEISVITIVGMGGVGKTTLTQLVYNDERVKRHFELEAWVCVTEEFDLFRIARTVLEASSPLTSDMKDLNLLQVKLKENLKGKKFLIVLDDVWNENYNDWDILLTPLKAGAKGSKIIATTRSEHVASIMCTLPTHHLEQLLFEDCWLLFAKHAFGNGGPSAYPNLEEIGKEIVKKCRGLPLAAKTLGGLLHSKTEAEEWYNVLHSEMWNLPSDRSSILPALRLSYSHLPPYLKRCFAYCSIFPKDYQFEKEKLILLWMAEGFLEQSKGKRRVEDVGDENFHELLSRSFFQKSSSKKSCFVMHDLINDLAKLVSGEFCIRLGDGKAYEISEKARHLSNFRGEYDAFEKFEAFINAKHLRTFLPLQLPACHPCYLSDRVSHDLLPTFRCLRVLSLCYYCISDLPDSIGNLKHLRYLDLLCTNIKRLPESVCALYNLQTLILTSCTSLCELPTGLGKLINLRYLDISKTRIKEMPSHIGQLKSLQMLSTFVVGKKSGSTISELKELSHIKGTLCISELQNVVGDMDSMDANLKDKKNLDELVMKWNRKAGFLQNGAGILDKLHPHTRIQRLTIECYYGVRFPNWLGDPSFLNIVFLSLRNCRHCSHLPPLGQLPSLKHLLIAGMYGVESVGAEFYGNISSSIKPFRSLEILRFEDLLKWEKWLSIGGEGGEFPRLQELYIQNCPKLTGNLPDHLPSLTKLMIERCQQLGALLPSVPMIHKLGLHNCDMVLFRVPPCGLTSLRSLEFSGISQWGELPCGLRRLSVARSDAVESLLEGMGKINTCLQDLVIRDCSFPTSSFRGALPTTLKLLRICNCRNIEFLLQEDMKSHYPFLERLYINGVCTSLKFFPLGFFPKLYSLVISELSVLESLSISVSEGELTSLEFLDINACPDLVSIELPSFHLAHYWICNCKNLKLLMRNISSFQSLILQDCPELMFPIGGLPSSICSFVIQNCDKLTPQVEWGLQRLMSLRRFSITGGCEDIVFFPKVGLLPSSLTSLAISNLPNLRSLDDKGLRQLTSLEKLLISNCPKLQFLTKDQLPTTLSFLSIKDCPSLKIWCQFRKGEGWPFIAHIPYIVIDDEVF